MQLFEVPNESVDSVVTCPPADVELASVLKVCFRALKPGGHALVRSMPRTSHKTGTALETVGFELRDVVTHHWQSATEFWWLCRKPTSEKTIAANTLKHGVGGINIDGCRIGTDTISTHGGDKWAGIKGDGNHGIGEYRTHVGRYPTNLVLSHGRDCELVGTATTGTGEPRLSSNVSTENFKFKEIFRIKPDRSDGVRSFGKETVESWKCVDGCPVKELNSQSGFSAGSGKRSAKRQNSMGFSGGAGTYDDFSYADAGGCGRFFWCATENTSFMRYLVRMVTPPGGVVLDPFGSKSTEVAAKEEGANCILVERTETNEASNATL